MSISRVGLVFAASCDSFPSVFSKQAECLELAHPSMRYLYLRVFCRSARLTCTPQAHNEYVLAEKRREEWELKNHREGEILEMVEIFEV